MALSNKMVDKIVKDRSYFEYGINVHTGEVVYSNGKYVVENEEGKLVNVEEKELKNDDILFVRYNEDTDRRIRDFLPRVLNQRGISDANDIDQSHPQVQAKIKSIRTAPGRNKRTVPEDEIIAIIEMVRKAHKPQYMLALMQIILWAMVYDDLFDIVNEAGKGIKLSTKFDFDVPDDYWNLSSKEEKDDLLYKLVTDSWKVDFKKYDKNNPLEMMLAYATTLLEEFPDITDTITVLQSNIVTAFTFAGGGAQFDDAGFLNSELDELLRRPVFRKNNIVEREEPSARVPRDNKKDKTEAPVGE